MKKIIIALCAFTLINSSCSTDELPEQPADQPKVYEVSFGLTGEITQTSQSPLTKASSNDLYGIQVTSTPVNSGEANNYAWGIFDDLSTVKIRLIEGYKYHFLCTMVRNGKSKICSYFLSDGKKYYGAPFDRTISNEFTYSVWDNWWGITRGNAYYYDINNDCLSFDRPNVDRYMGETGDFIPTDTAKISINMKRAVFGARFIADGLTEGKLNIQMENAKATYLQTDTLQREDIYTFSYPTNVIYDSNYTENILVSVNWQQNDSTTIPLASQRINFQRIKMTTVKRKVADQGSTKAVSFNIEEAPIVEGDSNTLNY